MEVWRDLVDIWWLFVVSYSRVNQSSMRFRGQNAGILWLMEGGWKNKSKMHLNIWRVLGGLGKFMSQKLAFVLYFSSWPLVAENLVGNPSRSPSESNFYRVLCKGGPRSLWWWNLKFLRVKHMVDSRVEIFSCQFSPGKIVFKFVTKISPLSSHWSSRRPN